MGGPPKVVGFVGESRSVPVYEWPEWVRRWDRKGWDGDVDPPVGYSSAVVRHASELRRIKDNLTKPVARHQSSTGGSPAAARPAMSIRGLAPDNAARGHHDVGSQRRTANQPAVSVARPAKPVAGSREAASTTKPLPRLRKTRVSPVQTQSLTTHPTETPGAVYYPELAHLQQEVYYPDLKHWQGSPGYHTNSHSKPLPVTKRHRRNISNITSLAVNSIPASSSASCDSPNGTQLNVYSICKQRCRCCCCC